MGKFFKILSLYWHMEPDADGALKQFLQAEYKKDWKYAYEQMCLTGKAPTWEELNRVKN